MTASVVGYMINTALHNSRNLESNTTHSASVTGFDFHSLFIIYGPVIPHETAKDLCDIGIVSSRFGDGDT